MTSPQIKTSCVAAVLLCLLLPAGVAPGGDKWERASLEGITEMGVAVEHLDAELLGIDKTVLQTAAELRLRRSGIKVAEEVFEPYLYINVNLVPVLDSYVAYHVAVKFNQLATLRVNGKEMSVTTWSEGFTGGVGKDNLRDAIREDINDKVDEFINDYLAANQDRPTIKTPR